MSDQLDDFEDSSVYKQPSNSRSNESFPLRYDSTDDINRLTNRSATGTSTGMIIISPKGSGSNIPVDTHNQTKDSVDNKTGHNGHNNKVGDNSANPLDNTYRD